MTETPSPSWFSVRCVFVFGETPDEPERTYEERVTMWRADAADEAIARAEADALEYVAALDQPPSAYLGLAQCYELFDVPGDGAAVISLMRGSTLEPDDYLDAFFDTGAERQRAIEQRVPDRRQGDAAAAPPP